ncbi:sorting nexin-11-like isoform X2 [Pomacea canaliculata]|uniref:sorting nexin-11-like isoform X2 n=1 Tax=Pomacea canaliculata TaxID=400727 RepID=UPI000D738062|nr:sorting nexin-11-like isoform X2 [Pomacea canaliculata]
MIVLSSTFGYFNVVMEVPECLVQVSNPKTVSFMNEGQFVTYEIAFETCDTAFRVKKSRVRRRYSDFIWLRNHLKEVDKWRSPPSLPPKNYFLTHPSEEFIERRSTGLQKWIVEVVSHPMYLSSMALHLFLQTELPLAKIEEYLSGKMSEEELTSIWGNEGRLYDFQPHNILHAYEPSAPCEISFSPDELGDIHPPSEPVKMSQTGIMQISLESPSSSYEEMGEQGRGLIRPCAVTPDSGFLCEEDNIIVVTQETNSSALKTHEDDDILLSQSTCSINGDSSDSQVLK